MPVSMQIPVLGWGKAAIFALMIALLHSIPVAADPCRESLKALKPYIGKPASTALKRSGLMFFPETPMPYGANVFYRAHYDNTLGINLVADKKTGIVQWAECVISEDYPSP